MVTELNVEKTLADRVMESVVTACNNLKGFDTLDTVGTSAMTEYVSVKGVPDNCWKDQGFQRVFDLLTVGLYFHSIHISLENMQFGEHFRKIAPKFNYLNSQKLKSNGLMFKSVAINIFF